MNLQEEERAWVDEADYAEALQGKFVELVDACPRLKEHRDYIKEQFLGFGDKSFHWLWKLLVDDMPNSFRFLEVGVYCGQIPSAMRLLADMAFKEAEIYGVTLLSSFGGQDTTFPDNDYLALIRKLHYHFDQPMPKLIVGDSTSALVHAQVTKLGLFDMVFVDGCHDYNYVLQDLLFYPTMVKLGGYLVIDDSANYLKQPWGFFQGIESVSRAARTVIETNSLWEHVVTVCHDRVWRRV